MGPKKDKKGSNKDKDKKEALPEVDKAFFELQIADLNRKLTRLRSTNAELKAKNEELSLNVKSMDDDRCDVIEYLKRILQQKSEQVEEIKERMIAMHDLQDAESATFKKYMEEADLKYKMMNEQLNAEIKLLNGKLNSLEEFRIMREDLMKKFETQEKEIMENQKSHEQQLYEMERDFIISKNKLKNEMESRLIKLSVDFQNTAELCIADTTKRAIKENITINNEIDSMIESQKQLISVNEKCKSRDVMYRLECNMYAEEKSKLFEKCSIQNKIISKLAHEYGKMKLNVENVSEVKKTVAEIRDSYDKSKLIIENLNARVRTLEDELHTSVEEKNTILEDVNVERSEKFKLMDVITKASVAVKAALDLTDLPMDEAERVSARENLMDTLLRLLNHARTSALIRGASTSTMKSLEGRATYVKGNLGLVPKATYRTKKSYTKPVPPLIRSNSENKVLRKPLLRQATCAGMTIQSADIRALIKDVEGTSLVRESRPKTTDVGSILKQQKDKSLAKRPSVVFEDEEISKRSEIQPHQ